MEAYSRLENITFENIQEQETRDDTQLVLRSFLDTELGFAYASNVEIQCVRIHRLRKKKGESPRPILARFLRAVESFFRWNIVYGEKIQNVPISSV